MDRLQLARSAAALPLRKPSRIVLLQYLLFTQAVEKDPSGFAHFMASELRRCGAAKDLAHGRQVHAHIITRCNNYEANTFTFLGNCLIEMYGNCGSMEDVRRVFNGLLQPNLHSWTIVIKAYAKNAQGRKALHYFEEMQRRGFEPNAVTFVCVLDACTCLGDLESGRRIHKAIVERGLEGDVFVSSALVNMYGKCGSLEEAKPVFDRMVDRNVVSWTTMIAAYTQNGHSKEALHLFGDMLHNAIKPNKVTFVCALHACANLCDLKEGRQMHAAIQESGLDKDPFVGTALVSMYGKCRKLEDARSMFRQMPHRNQVTWNAMIAACTQNGHSREALDLFQMMQEHGFRPNSVTFVCILDACASLAALKMGREIHTAIVNGRYDDHVIVGNALINMYGKCQNLDSARSVFAQMPVRNTISWNAMIAACSQNGHAKEALEYFNQMQNSGFKPDCVTFVCALGACASLVSLEKGKEIHGIVLESGYGTEVDVGTALVNMYSKCGVLKDARRVFCQMAHRNTVSWNAMIAACACNGNGNEALDLYYQMCSLGFKPDDVTFLSLLTACSNAGLVDDGRKHFDSMIKDYGMAQKGNHCASMIGAVCSAGRL